MLYICNSALVDELREALLLFNLLDVSDASLQYKKSVWNESEKNAKVAKRCCYCRKGHRLHGLGVRQVGAG